MLGYLNNSFIVSVFSSSTLSSPPVLQPQLSLCVFVSASELADAVMANLPGDHYIVTRVFSSEDLIQYVHQEQQQLDCLIMQADSDLPDLMRQIMLQDVVVPVVILQPGANFSEDLRLQSSEPIYHTSEIYLSPNQVNQVSSYVDKAISQFITHAITLHPSEESNHSDIPIQLTSFIVRQQRRLAEKLNERLGYLGVYYKRDPQNFLRNLPPAKRQDILEQLESKYRQIILSYFAEDKHLNNKIDEYVTIAFFADISVTRVVEIHMELMDAFSKQLKLEGRNEEILLDYRLTLIDTIAHLCEMYRRSIPRES
ncbi:MAG: circadian clock protein KaiA [Microcoleaceae cyanobacterium]